MFEDQDWDLDRVDLDQRAINQQDSRTETKIYLQRTEMTLQTTTTLQKERPSGPEQLPVWIHENQQSNTKHSLLSRVH